MIKTPYSSYALKNWLLNLPSDHGVSGSLRGYFQGTGTMIPTAVSQILEQIINAIVSVVAAGLLFHVGEGMNAAQGQRIILMR